MIRREPTKKSDKVKVTFVLPDHEGDVFVAGDFNAWSVGRTPLRRRGGVWMASLTLADRRYAFRYYQRGQWFNDEDADGYEWNEFGDKNAILDLTGPYEG